jgi:hypothetical protein
MRSWLRGLGRRRLRGRAVKSMQQLQSQTRPPSLAASTPELDQLAGHARKVATAWGCGKPCTGRGRGALPGLVMSAPEQPMLCAPIVSHTCAATMQFAAGGTSSSSATMWYTCGAGLNRRTRIDAERLFKPTVDAGVLQRVGLWVERRG